MSGRGCGHLSYLVPGWSRSQCTRARERELVHKIFRLSGPSEWYKEGTWLLVLVENELRQRPVKQGVMYVTASSFVRNHCLECGAEKGSMMSRFCSVCAEGRLRRHRPAEPDNIDRCVSFVFDDLDRIWRRPFVTAQLTVPTVNLAGVSASAVP